MDLNGRVAIVTGAARRQGIGQGIARALAVRGARVAVADIEADESAEIVQAISAGGGQAMFHAVDVTDRASVEELFSAVESCWGPVTIVASNAGIAASTSFERIEDAEFDAIVGVNLTGAFHVAQVAATRMLAGEPGGRIVFTSSVHAHMAFPLMAVYGATKRAIGALTEALALELAPHRVTVNHVGPGWVDSELTSSLLAHDHEAARAIVADVPARRAADPIEIGNAVAYLCTDAAEYITGAFVRIDGGFALGKY